MIALISLVRWRSLMTYFNDTYDDYIVPSIASITKEQFMAEIKANSNPCAIFSMGGGFERGFGIGVSDDDDDHYWVVGEYR